MFSFVDPHTVKLRPYASSALAGQVLVSQHGEPCSLFIQQMYRNSRISGLIRCLGASGLLLMPIPFVSCLTSRLADNCHDQSRTGYFFYTGPICR